MFAENAEIASARIIDFLSHTRASIYGGLDLDRAKIGPVFASKPAKMFQFKDANADSFKILNSDIFWLPG